jgi:hypothetical protein
METVNREQLIEALNQFKKNKIPAEVIADTLIGAIRNTDNEVTAQELNHLLEVSESNYPGDRDAVVSELLSQFNITRK